ncbi:MAG: alpha/beta fold hydrolase [Planctomycetales bacterium]|nr:alpha/beta fold hydrolase [Planctomycetales bacterium]
MTSIPLPRLVRRLAWLLAWGVLAWLIVSAIVAWRLTHRFAPPAAEPAPQVDWARFEELRLETTDGESLGAWLVRHETPVGSALVLHGIRGSRSGGRALIKRLHGHRLNVLAITLRGHGDSTGDVIDFGYGSRFDVTAGIDALRRECPEKPVFVFGQSLGAAAVLYAADHLDDRVAGVLLEHPYRDLNSAVWHRLSMHLPPGFDYLAYAGLRIWEPVFLTVPSNELAPQNYISKLPASLPVVLLNGAEDRRAPVEETRELGARAPRLLQFIEVPQVGHVPLSGAAPKLYDEAVDLLLRTGLEDALRASEAY